MNKELPPLSIKPLHIFEGIRTKSIDSVRAIFVKSKVSIEKIRSKRVTPSSISLSMKDQIFFAKRLSFLSKAGVPLLEALMIIREQTRSKRYGIILDSVVHSVSNGQSLSGSLSKFRNTFGEFAINIIDVGESTGTLSENLEYLSEELKKKHVLKRKVIGAFVYPAVVTLATISIVVFLMVYLFPKIMPVFNSLRIQLPLSTRMVIWASETTRDYGLYILMALILAIAAFIFTLKRSTKFHLWYDRMLLKIPIVGPMIQYFNLANLTRTLGLLLKSGLTLSESLPIASNTARNLVYRKECNALVAIVARGEKISTYLKKHPKIFPDVLTQIISVGERGGNLSNSLVYLSELYEGEVDDFTKNLSNMIEPILMIVMGVMVGFIAISIITPIYGITQNLHG